MKKTSLGILFITLCFSLSTFAVSQSMVTKKEVKETYYQWCKAIGTAKGNPQEVVRFYAPDATLVPTLSHKILHNTDGGLDAYFSKLTSFPNIHCDPERENIRIHDGTVINSGLYEFSYTNKEGRKVEIPSRFTFVYKRFGDKWLIINHHSSKMPE